LARSVPQPKIELHGQGVFEAGSFQPESLPARPSTDLDDIKNVEFCHLGLLKLSRRSIFPQPGRLVMERDQRVGSCLMVPPRSICQDLAPASVNYPGGTIPQTPLPMGGCPPPYPWSADAGGELRLDLRRRRIGQHGPIREHDGRHVWLPPFTDITNSHAASSCSMSTSAISIPSRASCRLRLRQKPHHWVVYIVSWPDTRVLLSSLQQVQVL